MAKAPPKTDREVRTETMTTLRRVCGANVDSFETAAELCRAEIKAAGEYPKDLVSHLAWITNQMVPVMNELRQQDKAELREVARIPLETILSHLKTLSADIRAGIAAEITGADAGESLL